MKLYYNLSLIILFLSLCSLFYFSTRITTKTLNPLVSSKQGYIYVVLGEGFSSSSIVQVKQGTTKRHLINTYKNSLSNQSIIEDIDTPLVSGQVVNIKDTTNKKQQNIQTNNTQKKPINLATVDELMQLSGIGEKTATEIVNYINSNSSLLVNDLLNIKGVGEKTVETVKTKYY